MMRSANKGPFFLRPRPGIAHPSGLSQDKYEPELEMIKSASFGPVARTVGPDSYTGVTTCRREYSLTVFMRSAHEPSGSHTRAIPRRFSSSPGTIRIRRGSCPNP